MDSKYSSQIKYMADRCKRVYIRLSESVDGDLLDMLDSLSNKQGYIRQLIRDDFNGEKKFRDFQN